jgi:hypothetical protein
LIFRLTIKYNSGKLSYMERIKLIENFVTGLSPEQRAAVVADPACVLHGQPGLRSTEPLLWYLITPARPAVLTYEEAAAALRLGGLEAVTKAEDAALKEARDVGSRVVQEIGSWAKAQDLALDIAVRCEELGAACG